MYTVRRWITAGGDLFDDSRKAKTAEEAITEADRLCGFYTLGGAFADKVRALGPGEAVRIRRPSLKLTVIVKRSMRN